MKRSPKFGREGFRRILSLTRPVGDSHEIWLKLGHDQFIVGNYSADGHFPIWSTSGSGKNRKRTKQHPDCWEYVFNWAKSNDGGVFFIPTQPQGYPLAEAIAFSDDVAAELDEGTAEQQWDKITEFVEISGLEPAYIIHSGSKSYHPHWKATEHLPIAQTIYLRQLLCIALNSDPAIANPHQPMRLAGFYRREKGREQTLEYSSDSRSTYDELITGIKVYYEAKNLPFPENISSERWRIYKRAKREGHLDLSILTKPESELYPQSTYRLFPTVSTAYRGRIPLHLALSKANQEALKGVGSERNQTGIALAKDLIGCYEWLINQNYEVEGEPYQLFIDYCQACTTGGGWNEREWETIWRSASRGNPTPARNDLSNFIHWYRRENDPEYRQVTKRQQRTERDGEPDQKAYQEYVDWESEQEKIESAIEKSEFYQWLSAKAKGLGQKFQKGFGQYQRLKKPIIPPKTIPYSPNNPLPSPSDYEGQDPPRIRFKQGIKSGSLQELKNGSKPKKGERHPVIVKLLKLGWQFILDRSFMGLGKSHDLGNFVNQSGKTWYLNLNHRNPSTETVEKNFVDLDVRHNGLNRDENRKTPLGNPYLVWAKEDEYNPDIESLCHNAHLFIKLNNKGYPIDSLKDTDEENSLNPICKTCIFHKWKVENEKGEKVAICSAQKGKGYGFRSARRVGLSHSRIRASPDSLPSLEEFDYSQDIAIVDEASQIIRGSQTVRATYQDFLVKMMELEKIPELFNALKPLRERLTPILSGQEKLPRYGLNHEQVIELLGEPIAPEILAEIIELVAQTNPEWAQLLVTAAKHKGWGRQWFNAMRTANWYERMEAKQETLENINNLPSNFLIDLLSVWAGLIPGAIRIDRHRQLSIHTEDTTHGDKLREFKQVILLDATANKDMLSRRIGINPHEMIEIEEELPPLKNLTVVNVQMEGLGSGQYSEQAISRVNALIKKLREKHGEMAILGLKKYWSALDLDGNWFNDNRGSNRFKAKQALVTVGTPYVNVGEVEDEYLTLYGTLRGFEEYYQSLIESEVIQLVGRPRAHLYPDQDFVIYMVGTDQNLDYLRQYGINVVNRHAFEITPEAGSKGQISKYKFIRAIAAIINQFGSKQINRKTIATETGLSEDYIKKLVQGLGGIKAFRKWVLSLYNSNRSSTHLLSPEMLLDEKKIRDWLNLEPMAVIRDLVEMIVNCGCQDFVAYLNCFSADVGSRLWGLIAPLFWSDGAMVELAQITDT